MTKSNTRCRLLPGRQTGFTLVELVTVITIAGMLFLLVLPNLGNREDNLRSDTRKLAALFRALGDQAVFTKVSTPFRVDLDNQQWSYTLDGEDKTGKPSRGVRVEEALAASSGPVRSGIVELKFTEGGPDETVRIYLSREEDEMTVTIYPFSGRVRVDEGRVSEESPAWSSDEPSRPLAAEASSGT